MNNIFDDFCRKLAEPMPRKRALKLIAGGLAGAVLAPFASFAQGQGPDKPAPAPPSGGGGGGKKCPSGQCACTGVTGGCCPGGQSCYSNKVCCGTGYVGGTCGSGKNAKLMCLELAASNTWANNCTPLTKTGC